MLAALAGPSVSFFARTSTLELFTIPLFIHSNFIYFYFSRSLRPQCGTATAPASCGNELSNLLAPFQNICTPMHTSRNAVSFKITFVPVAPILLARRSA